VSNDRDNEHGADRPDQFGSEIPGDTVNLTDQVLPGSQDGDGEQAVNVKKPLHRFKKGLLIGTVVLIILALATGVYALAFFGQVKETQRVLLDEVTFETIYTIDEVFPEHIVNIGLLGFDRGWNRESMGEYLFRPDMLAVLSINFDSGQISVVRIPRDSYVPIHGMNGFHDKINHSFYYGYIYGSGDDPEAEGIRYTLQTVSNVLGGIPIHYHLSIDMYSIIELVDAMGGVYYEVEEEIIDKYWDVGRVLVPAGPQIMDGKTFLRYLQYRDDKTNQDYGRIDRQMNLLKETFYYLREQGRITDIPATYRIYKDYVETDLSYKQIAALAYYARDLNMSDENLHFYTVPGGGDMKDGIWYQVISDDQRLQIIKDVFGIDAEPWPPIVLVDSPEYLEEQEEKRRLEELGITEENNGTEDDEISEENSDDETLTGSEDDLINEELEERQLAVVPDLRGKTVEQARTILESELFIVGSIETRFYFLLEKGLVIQSNPLPGSLIQIGDTINLVVSDGPDPNGS
jgi:polyisoprenyl-teichoic acid--peptidoglycan teichoic acid transferase